MVGQSDFGVPIRAQFDRARQDLSNSYINPLGAYTTPDVRDKAMREQNFNLDQGQAVALGNAANQNQQNAFGQQATVAGLTAPVSYNSGSTKSDKWTGGDTLSTGLGIGTGVLSAF